MGSRGEFRGPLQPGDVMAGTPAAAAPAAELMDKPEACPTALGVRIAMPTERCVCGDEKKAGQPFCFWCYCSLSTRVQDQVRRGVYDEALQRLDRRMARRPRA